MDFVTQAYASLGFATDVFRSLQVNRSNWTVFKIRMETAADYGGIKGHFDGSTKMPKPSNTRSELESAYKEELATWQMNEDVPRYILTKKIPECVLKKYARKDTAAEIWASVVNEFAAKVEVPPEDVVAAIATSSERLSMDTGYSRRCRRERKRGRAESPASEGRSPNRHSQGTCWNCGGRGHKRATCTSPMMDNKECQYTSSSKDNNNTSR
jgi:hypothetical protein